MRQAELLRLFNNQDEKSVDFSEDPEMYQKLDMKKPKRGEERPYDIEKIYRFQLEKDIAKIRESKGEYADRNELYMSLRHRDPNYHKVAAPTEVGVDGNFNDLIKYTKDESWKSTSKPYGEIAHKRYLEWLANLPKGPTEEELKDKAQRKQDQELWRQIVSGELELTKKDLKRAERDRINRLREEEDDKHKNEYLEEKRRRYQAIESEQFELLRKLPTKREFKASKKKWHKGIHYPYNFDKGFPVVMARKKDQLQPISNLEKPFVPRQFSSDVILNGYYDCEKQYGDYLAEINFKKAEKYIKNHYYTIEKERKKKEKQAEIDKMNRRRQGRLGVDILTDVAAAKYLTTKDKLAYTVKLDDDEDGEGQRSGGKSYEVSIGRKKQKKVIEFDQLEKIVSGEIKKQSKKESVYEKTSSDEEEEKEEEEKVGDDSDSSSEISEEEEEEDDGDKEEEEKDNLDDDDRQLGRISLQVASPRRGFFRSPSSIFPESLFFSSPSSSKKNKSKKNKKNSSYFQFTLPDFSKLDWDDVTFFYEDTKKSFKRSSFYKFITKSRRMTEPYKAPTTRRKEEALKDIIKLGEIISNPKYLETRLELSSNELTMEEFELLTKRKKKELKLHIKELTKRNPTKEEQHELLKYQKRYQLLEEMIQERYERYSKAEELINIIKILLEKKYNNIEKDIHEPVMEQYQRYWMNKCFYSPLIYKKMPKKLENLLPNPNEPEKVQEIVEALLSHRFSERIQMIKQRRIWYRISHFGFANVDAFDDKIKRQRRNHTPDDLLLAVQSGDYRHVIDILDPARDSIEDKFNQDELGVKIDDISSDGLTPMYACLSMILNKEVLDTDANLDDLLLTNWQRRKKRFFSLFQSKTKALLSTARFDYVLLILIYYGGNLNFPRVEFGKDGLTILHLACQQGALEMIQWLLQKGVDINQLSALQYRTPLMFAVERDQLETMLLLLREGAILGIHHIDNNGNNVLHYAALYARPLITQILLICGVKSNIRNKKGYLPAEEAKMSGRLEIATTILTFKDDVIDHMQRIDYLVSRIDVPFDYHTGKSYDLNNVSNPEIPDVTPPPADSTVHRTRHHHPGGGSETAIREEDEEEDDNDNEEEGDVFPVESPSLALVIDPSSRKTDPSAVSSTSEEATPNTRRINKIWNAIQRPLRTAYSSPDMTVQEHLKKVKEDHSKSAPSLLPRIDLPLSAIGRVSSVIGPKLVGDGMKKKEKAEVKNADEIIVAPKLRRTILQLNYSRKANVKSPQS